MRLARSSIYTGQVWSSGLSSISCIIDSSTSLLTYIRTLQSSSLSELNWSKVVGKVCAAQVFHSFSSGISRLCEVWSGACHRKIQVGYTCLFSRMNEQPIYSHSIHFSCLTHLLVKKKETKEKKNCFLLANPSTFHGGGSWLV